NVTPILAQPVHRLAARLREDRLHVAELQCRAAHEQCAEERSEIAAARYTRNIVDARQPAGSCECLEKAETNRGASYTATRAGNADNGQLCIDAGFCAARRGGACLGFAQLRWKIRAPVNFYSHGPSSRSNESGRGKRWPSRASTS